MPIVKRGVRQQRANIFARFFDHHAPSLPSVSFLFFWLGERTPARRLFCRMSWAFGISQITEITYTNVEAEDKAIDSVRGEGKILARNEDKHALLSLRMFCAT